MKRAPRKKSDPEMLKEYNFSKGARGKYAKRYAAGSNVVVVPPDLARAFPTSEAVQETLRNVISLAKNVTDKTPPRHRKKSS